MHDAIVAGCFLLLVLIPCLVAVYSSSREGRTGNTGEHAIAQEPQKPAVERMSRVRQIASSFTSTKAHKVVTTDTPPAPQRRYDRPSRIQMVAAAFVGASNGSQMTVDQPSRIRRVATALTRREPQVVPMVSGDPGQPRHSIRDLRAKQAAAAKSKQSS